MRHQLVEQRLPREGVVGRQRPSQGESLARRVARDAGVDGGPHLRIGSARSVQRLGDDKLRLGARHERLPVGRRARPAHIVEPRRVRARISGRLPDGRADVLSGERAATLAVVELEARLATGLQ